MPEDIKGITWEAPEHHHIEKGSDWFWGLGIIAVTAATIAIIFGNTLFGVLIFLASTVMIIFAVREPRIMPFAVTTRGIRMGNDLYPYTTLHSFCIDEEHEYGPQLLVRSQHLFMPLIIIPIPEEYTDDIDDLIGTRLPEEHLEEPFASKLLEFFGF